MKQSLLQLLCVLLFATVCNAQPAAPVNQLYDKTFNWHITIPAEFKSISTEEFAALLKRGTDAMEKTVNAPIENHSTPIFVYRADQLHYFESNSQPFDPKTDGDYTAVCKKVDEVVYKTFVQQMPGAKIDTTMTTEVVDKLKFERFTATITLPNNMVLNMLIYNHLFDKKELTITIMYVDKDKGEQLLGAWRNSKFE